jgi:hypothetical protein
MNKNLQSILFTIVLSNSLIAGELIFDLGAQQLSRAQDGEYKMSTYDLGKTLVSTGMISTGSAYRPKDGYSGSITAHIKEPKSNWGVTFDMYCYLHHDGCGVELLGTNGNTITISLEKYHISVDGNRTKDTNLYLNTEVQGSVHRVGNSDSIEVIVNGYEYILNKPNFKLAHINMSVSTEDNYDSYKIDKINSLAISTSDE